MLQLRQVAVSLLRAVCTESLSIHDIILKYLFQVKFVFSIETFIFHFGRYSFICGTMKHLSSNLIIRIVIRVISSWGGAITL